MERRFFNILFILLLEINIKGILWVKLIAVNERRHRLICGAVHFAMIR